MRPTSHRPGAAGKWAGRTCTERGANPKGGDRRRWATAAWVLLMLLCAGPALALDRPVRIGVLTPAWGPPGGLDHLVEGLIDLGYRENEDFVIGVRFTQGNISALPAAAKAMVEGGVDFYLPTTSLR
jgi:hypothetical protein